MGPADDYSHTRDQFGGFRYRWDQVWMGSGLGGITYVGGICGRDPGVTPSGLTIVAKKTPAPALRGTKLLELLGGWL